MSRPAHRSGTDAGCNGGTLDRIPVGRVDSQPSSAHSRASGNPGAARSESSVCCPWVPAFAGTSGHKTSIPPERNPRLVFDDVVDFERLVLGREPFGARRRPPLAALVERQLQGCDQVHDLLPGGHMGEARAGAERVLVEVVERGETTGEEFTIDGALGEPVGAAEAEPGRKLEQAFADKALVARAEHRQ